MCEPASPGKVLRFFTFLTGEGATENFSWPFPDFLMSEKNRWGGGQKKIFSDVIFLRPLTFILNESHALYVSDVFQVMSIDFACVL